MTAPTTPRSSWTLAAEAGIRSEYETYPLEAANDALLAIAADAVRGAAVLQIS